jgi:hypothetical protein
MGSQLISWESRQGQQSLQMSISLAPAPSRRGCISWVNTSHQYPCALSTVTRTPNDNDKDSGACLRLRVCASSHLGCAAIWQLCPSGLGLPCVWSWWALTGLGWSVCSGRNKLSWLCSIRPSSAGQPGQVVKEGAEAQGRRGGDMQVLFWSTCFCHIY